MLTLADYIAAAARALPPRWSGASPWELTAAAEQLVDELLRALPPSEFDCTGRIAVHRSAIVETGATLKAPLVGGARCFIAAGAYLRGGCWLDGDCIVGPGAELKSSLVFAGSKLAHFNFVGDSVLGAGVNLEAGAIVCNYRNYRNESSDKRIHVRVGGRRLDTGVDKFGALIGDGARIGANAVLAPGTVLAAGTVVARGATLDQDGAAPRAA